MQNCDAMIAIESLLENHKPEGTGGSPANMSAGGPATALMKTTVLALCCHLQVKQLPVILFTGIPETRNRKHAQTRNLFSQAIAAWGGKGQSPGMGLSMENL